MALVPLRTKAPRARPPMSRPRAAMQVALVAMPFVSRYQPSLQLGLLTAIGRAHGFSVRSFHVALDFAAQIGPHAYEMLCQHRACVSAEWLFAREAFGEAAPDDEAAFFADVGSRLDGVL